MLGMVSVVFGAGVMFRAGGWLRCDVVRICVVLTLSVIHYTYLYITIIILYLILYLILYYILSYTILYFSSPLSFPFLYSSSSYPILLIPSHSSHIHSILVGTYIYLFIFFPNQQSDPAQIIGGMSRVV